MVYLLITTPKIKLLFLTTHEMNIRIKHYFLKKVKFRNLFKINILIAPQNSCLNEDVAKYYKLVYQHIKSRNFFILIVNF